MIFSHYGKDAVLQSLIRRRDWVEQLTLDARGYVDIPGMVRQWFACDTKRLEVESAIRERRALLARIAANV